MLAGDFVLVDLPPPLVLDHRVRGQHLRRTKEMMRQPLPGLPPHLISLVGRGFFGRPAAARDPVGSTTGRRVGAGGGSCWSRVAQHECYCEWLLHPAQRAADHVVLAELGWVLALGAVVFKPNTC